MPDMQCRSADIGSISMLHISDAYIDCLAYNDYIHLSDKYILTALRIAIKFIPVLVCNFKSVHIGCTKGAQKSMIFYHMPPTPSNSGQLKNTFPLFCTPFLIIVA